MLTPKGSNSHNVSNSEADKFRLAFIESLGVSYSAWSSCSAASYPAKSADGCDVAGPSIPFKWCTWCTWREGKWEWCMAWELLIAAGSAAEVAGLHVAASFAKEVARGPSRGVSSDCELRDTMSCDMERESTGVTDMWPLGLGGTWWHKGKG